MGSLGRGFSRAARARIAAVAALTTISMAAPASADTTNYTAPGTYTYTVPAGVTEVEVDLWGAMGAPGAVGVQYTASGRGGRTHTTLAVTPGQTLQVNVGGPGEISFSGSAGGFNGGGAGNYDSDWYGSGGGGGATDIRTGAYALADRIVIAGGGAGGGGTFSGTAAGGAGGGLTGLDGSGSTGRPPNQTPVAGGGSGASQTSGGAGGPDAGSGILGLGGAGAYRGGGGGGGLYGGGGGGQGTGGGGGSGYGPAGTTFETGAVPPHGWPEGYARIAFGPKAPTGLTTTPASPSNVNDITVSGTAPAGTTVKLYANKECSGDPVATGSAADFGSPGFAVQAPSDTWTNYAAIAVDTAGFQSSCSQYREYREDSTAPAASPTVQVLPGGPANQTAIRVKSAVENPARVEVFDTADCTGTPVGEDVSYTANAEGVAVTVPDDSSTTFRLVTIDQAGNRSPCSTASATYVEDSTAPSLPTELTLTPGASGSGDTVWVKGTAEGGTRVNLYTDAGCAPAQLWAYETAEVFKTEGVAYDSADPNTTTTLTLRVRDAAGNLGPCTEPFTYTRDTLAPDAPTGLALAGASPGTDRTPRVRGSAEEGGTVDLFLTENCSGTPAASGTSAAFAGAGIVVPVPADATSVVRALVEDAAGNPSTCSVTGAEYVHDATAPVVTLTTPLDGASGTDRRPSFSGRGGTAARDTDAVQVEITGTDGTVVTTLAATRAAATGDWSARPDADLPTGTYTARAIQRDDLGNVGRSGAVAFTVSDPPATPQAPSGGTPQQPAAPLTPATPAAPVAGRLTLVTKSVKAKRGKAALKLSCATATCAGKLTLTMKSGRRMITVGSATYRVAAGKQATVSVKLSKALLKLLKTKKRASVTVAPGAGAPTKLTIKI